MGLSKKSSEVYGKIYG